MKRSYCAFHKTFHKPSPKLQFQYDGYVVVDQIVNLETKLWISGWTSLGS